MSYILRVIPEDVFNDLNARGLISSENTTVIKSKISSPTPLSPALNKEEVKTVQSKKRVENTKKWNTFDSKFKIKK